MSTTRGPSIWIAISALLLVAAVLLFDAGVARMSRGVLSSGNARPAGLYPRTLRSKGEQIDSGGTSQHGAVGDAAPLTLTPGMGPCVISGR